MEFKIEFCVNRDQLYRFENGASPPVVPDREDINRFSGKYMLFQKENDFILVLKTYAHRHNEIEVPQPGYQRAGGGMIYLNFKKNTFDIFSPSSDYGQADRGKVKSIIEHFYPQLKDENPD